jgi:hypothetical protein
MNKTNEAMNKTLVLEAFHTLFNNRDYAAAENFGRPATSNTVPISPLGARDCSI